MDAIFDIAIIGGGINGTALAADAALRGLSVVLFEKDDLASKTSSNSTKLIHGGLRYLENYDFSMVRKALQEREILLKLAPHIIHPCPFVLPFVPSMRPLWVLRTGLFFYDHLYGKNSLPRSSFIRANNSPRHPEHSEGSISDRISIPGSLATVGMTGGETNKNYFAPLIENFTKGLLYYDCVTGDARLTITQALQAKKHGALIYTYTKLTQAVAKDKLWHLQVSSKSDGLQTFCSRVLINASGAFASSLNKALAIKNSVKISLVKGSHLLVPKLYPGKQSYLLQNEDKRIVFVVSYQGLSLIGTTDVLLQEACPDLNLDNLKISPTETAYLLKIVAKYFQKPLSEKAIVHSFSGVRSLLSTDGTSPQSLSRDCFFKFEEIPAPSITIYSGKLTSHRYLAAKAIDALTPIFPKLPPSKTAQTPLPGAGLDGMSYEDYKKFAAKKYNWLDKALLARWLNTYGSNTEKILQDCHNTKDLGQHFALDLYQCEVDYLCKEEWAKTPTDILWRRTKLGIFYPQQAYDLLEKHIK